MRIFYKIKSCLYNIKEIINFSKEGLGKAIIYALVLCTFIGTSKGIIYCINVNSSINVLIEKITQEELSIIDGELNIKTPSVNEESNGILFYMDDNIKLDEYENLKNIYINSDQFILLLKDGIVINYNLLNKQTIGQKSYKDLGIDNIDNKFAKSSLENSKILVFPTLIISSIFDSFVNYLMDSVVITLLSLLNIYILKLKISFKKALSLVIYASTLPSVIVMLLNMVSPRTSFSTASLIGTMLVTYIIINVIKKSGETLI